MTRKLTLLLTSAVVVSFAPAFDVSAVEQPNIVVAQQQQNETAQQRREDRQQKQEQRQERRQKTPDNAQNPPQNQKPANANDNRRQENQTAQPNTPATADQDRKKRTPDAKELSTTAPKTTKEPAAQQNTDTNKPASANNNNC